MTEKEFIAKEETGREKIIIRTSIIGIAANVLLAAFKATVGLVTHSIAIVMDAVNNISDAASSLITIIGTKLAGKEPDKKHPFGYGRIEYMSAMVISVIVLYAGITSLVESVKAIITPEQPDYSTASLIIVAAAVVVKILLGRYVKSVGVKVNSDSLVNSGEDATLDSVISASTLAAAFVYIFFHISLEAYLGAVISVIIIKSGFEMLSGTVSKILGEAHGAELASDIKATVASFEPVKGVYDLVLHNYGPDSFNGSVHIELEDTMGAEEIDRLLRDITMTVYRKHNVVLTAIGVYSINTKDPENAEMRKKVRDIVFAHDHVMQMHAFNYNKEKKKIRFDVVVSFDAPDRRKVIDDIIKDVKASYPDCELEVALDTDFTGD